ncbi:MAG: hypothetical protein ABIR51_00105 [Sphingomicrobium sp.]
MAAAYPLIRTVAPAVTAEQWLDYARKVRMRGGLLGLIGAENALFGLLTYRTEESLRHGRIFHVDNFVTFELNRAAPGRNALCEAAEALARKEGCTVIEFRLDSRGYTEGGTVKSQGWLNLGHSLDAVVLTKSLGFAIEAGAAAPVLCATTA